MGVIYFLLWSYLIYRILGFLMRLATPFLLRHMSNKMKDNFSQNKRSKSKKNEGEVTIDKMPKRNKESNNKIGDYVDYEELD